MFSASRQKKALKYTQQRVVPLLEYAFKSANHPFKFISFEDNPSDLELLMDIHFHCDGVMQTQDKCWFVDFKVKTMRSRSTRCFAVAFETTEGNSRTSYNLWKEQQTSSGSSIRNILLIQAYKNEKNSLLDLAITSMDAVYSLVDPERCEKKDNLYLVPWTWLKQQETIKNPYNQRVHDASAYFFNSQRAYCTYDPKRSLPETFMSFDTIAEKIREDNKVCS
jgi:hypothetical protein